MILTDNETKIDLLNNEAIAATIVKLLRDRPDRPVTIGVHGDWGAGKSSVLEMIEAGLADEDRILCLKFNGWRFQGFEDAKIALIEGIVTELVEKRPALTKAADAVKEVFQRIDWLKVAKKAGGLAFTAYTGIPAPDQIHTAIGMIEGLFADPLRFASKENVAVAIEGAKGVLKPKSETKNVPTEIDGFRKAFDKLLKQADIDRLVVLIDDLDRCLPDTAIETLEAVRLFVFTARTAFVVAADEAMIEYAVRKHFPELPDTTGPRDYARNYLEKLIQVPFRIPALGETETRMYVTLLLIGAEIGDESVEFSQLISTARAHLRRPWEGARLGADEIRAALGEKSGQAQGALVLSDQIAPILAAGTKGNPRQVKRFLNTLLLRQRTAEARGFGSEVKLPVLAKLMLAERFQPRLFDQIAYSAAAHPGGLSADLAPLETSAAEKGESAEAGEHRVARGATSSKDTRKLEVVKPTESALLAEWLVSKAILAWARVSPPLAAVDLRPYLFVAKDRKDYFGAASALGLLAAVVEQLLGPKLSVQALDGELKRLAPAEAAEVFDAVRSRILSGDTFDTEPAGIAGLVVLIKGHPELQSKLLDLLEGMPSDRLGPWVVSGWEGVIRDREAGERFDRLLDGWASNAHAPFLKSAATSVRQTRRGTH
jgi:predicted KAP-like P-loop ATPase